MPNEDVLRLCRDRARRKILFLPHAVKQMCRPERMITTGDVERVIASGKLIEDYPEDVRGHSCLLVGDAIDGRIIHVVCAPKQEYLAIITAYVPDPSDWEENLEMRKTR